MNADKRGYCMRNLRSSAVILSEFLPDLHGFLVQIRADQCHPSNPCSATSLCFCIGTQMTRIGWIYTDF